DQHVSRNHEVIGPAQQNFAVKSNGEIADLEPVIKILGPGFLDHAGREIDANEIFDQRSEFRACKPGTAAEIEHAGKSHGSVAAAGGALDRLAKNFWAP